MALQRLVDLANIEDWLRKIFNSVNYARTGSDQLRVNVDNQPNMTLNMNSSGTSLVGAALAPAWFAVTAWNAMDARETARVASEQQWAINRQRWSIT